MELARPVLKQTTKVCRAVPRVSGMLTGLAMLAFAACGTAQAQDFPPKILRLINTVGTVEGLAMICGQHDDAKSSRQIKRLIDIADVATDAPRARAVVNIYFDASDRAIAKYRGSANCYALSLNGGPYQFEPRDRSH